MSKGGLDNLVAMGVADATGIRNDFEDLVKEELSSIYRNVNLELGNRTTFTFHFDGDFTLDLFKIDVSHLDRKDAINLGDHLEKELLKPIKDYVHYSQIYVTGNSNHDKVRRLNPLTGNKNKTYSLNYDIFEGEMMITMIPSYKLATAYNLTS